MFSVVNYSLISHRERKVEAQKGKLVQSKWVNFIVYNLFLNKMAVISLNGRGRHRVRDY